MDDARDATGRRTGRRPGSLHGVEITDLEAAPDRAEELRSLSDSSWPGFLLHADVRNWSALYGALAAFQLLLIENGTLIGAGLTAPLSWRPDDALPETIDWVTYHARWPLDGDSGVLCALAALVASEHRGRGLSREIIRGMCRLAARHGLEGVVAPVRPTRKHESPHEPIDVYADRRDESGRLVDPWLRVHETLGGRRLGIATRALTVRGSLGDWERWTGRRFPESGIHVVEGALVPVAIDLIRDVGEYVEPNVWYLHAPAPSE